MNRWLTDSRDDSFPSGQLLRLIVRQLMRVRWSRKLGGGLRRAGLEDSDWVGVASADDVGTDVVRCSESAKRFWPTLSELVVAGDRRHQERNSQSERSRHWMTLAGTLLQAG